MTAHPEGLTATEDRSSGSVLSASDVTYGYEGVPVLDNCSLSVPRGDVVSVIGPSGVGKTTLLRLLGVFDAPDEGTVAVDGTDAWSVGERDRLELRRRTATVFQDASLFDASVARNVEYGLRVRRDWGERIRNWFGGLTGPSETTVAVSEALSAVGLADYADRPASSLSGGEAARVAFARALAYDPDVLLLDEPTSDLDPRNTAAIEDAIRAARDRDIGVVLATHDMHQAERVADRVAVLLGDDFAEVGPTEQVFESPRDDRTARFVAGELVY